ncbi:hypothetical protein COV06_00910 [Candidatus Uhrbacteria bacterium CG10_big_fil_rev_8_21_14_0_10_50_16]|uniref:Primosomal protein N' 3' DNA-binding domain-containing protein n=1 Tax=Candidatus Uhrbacteria bacterium CG10_big_fil_rev_8_21_14_0_10_50_16 TaxID=1975039 RepID=A0A2H0RND6_9BACT|nr:MAG: hypothetical protein COV06_00910 [Candidatus Uhrbacteria bacterium CG10_big_fil_rev_8_21_14_0_10_50_16]
MYCKVAPIRRFPRSVEPYDYQIPEDLTVDVGSFVEVPLRNTPVIGIVTAIMDVSEFSRVAFLTKILSIPALSTEDVHFYQRLAVRTYQSLSSILFAAIPLPPKRFIHKSRPVIERGSFGITPQEALTLKTCLTTVTESHHSCLCLPNDRVGLGLVLALLKTTTDPLFVLVPDVHMAEAVLRVGTIVTEDCKLFLAKQSKTEAYESWCALREGTCRLIISTRSGALVPPHASTRIVMLGSGEDDFAQWDQNPHYDARWCLATRRDTHSNATVEIDVFPRVEDGDVTLDVWKTPDVQIVDMQTGARLSDHYLLSIEALTLIRTTDTTNAPLVIFYNRLQRADNDAYVGVEALAQLVRKEFPDKFVHVVNAQTNIPANGIVIVTRTLLFQWDYLEPHMAGLIVLRPEHNLIYRGFRSLEQATRELRRLVSFAASAHAPCLIQAREPHVVEEMLGPTTVIRSEELHMRKTLHYPPFGDFHVVRAKDQGSRELIESYRVQHAGAGSGQELVLRTEPNGYIPEWLTWPPSCDMFVSPDSME